MKPTKTHEKHVSSFFIVREPCKRIELLITLIRLYQKVEILDQLDAPMSNTAKVGMIGLEPIYTVST